MTLLSDKINIKRRYFRSINIERDLDNVDAVSGFIVTTKARECLDRFADGFATRRGNRAWTLTGPYGSGKSALAHFLLSILGEQESPSCNMAHEILLARKSTRSVSKKFDDTVESEFLRCTVTCRLEPLSTAIYRALRFGVDRFFKSKRSRSQSFWHELQRLDEKIASGNSPSEEELLHLLRLVSASAKAPIIIILDELGKCLEFAARRKHSDLYVLQQLAELPIDDCEPRLFIIGLLHQSFADYADSLSHQARNEWQKIQGRFEDISFTESTQESLSLLSDAIEISDKVILKRAAALADSWLAALKAAVPKPVIPESACRYSYPLHPLTATLLPALCNKLGQNERSLFTFLTSDEPTAFNSFLKEAETQSSYLPTYKLCHLFDYLSEAGLKTGSNRGLGARWTEIEEKISSQSSLDRDQIDLLKTVGLFNLISTGGALRASRRLITLAMVDDPSNQSELSQWDSLLDDLFENRTIGYRKHIDEYRVWDGTDFDIEAAISHYRALVPRNFAESLSKLQRLSPFVAQRNSYETGTLRLFDALYSDDSSIASSLQPREGADGLVIFWLATDLPENREPITLDGRPVVVLITNDIETLHDATIELLSLQALFDESAELQVDKVARKEVRNRLLHAQIVWDDTFRSCFGFSSGQTDVMVGDERHSVFSEREFNGFLSTLADSAYGSSPRLWNELINRRELTSQGAKARRELIEAMFIHPAHANLSLVGNGPEVSMYRSMLLRTGIHKNSDSVSFFQPPEDSTFLPAWRLISSLIEAGSLINVEEIHNALENPPIGLKAGPIPILLAAFLIHHQEDVSVYRDNSFIGTLGPEHFELLVKDPSRFAVKSLSSAAQNSKLFECYAKIAMKQFNRDMLPPNKTSILSAVKPLMNFIRRLPPYAQNSVRLLPPDAIAVRQCILGATEPDSLLFKEIPKALGFSAIADDANNRQLLEFQRKLTAALNDLGSAVQVLIDHCAQIIATEFGVTPQGLSKQVVPRLMALEQVLEKSEFSPLAFQLGGLSVTDHTDTSRRLAMVIADKPPESWTDADLESFPLKARVYIRKLRDFEALHAEMTASEFSEYETNRISIVSAFGEPLNKVVQINKADLLQAEDLAETIIREHLTDNASLTEAVILKLIERIFKRPFEVTREACTQ